MTENPEGENLNSAGSIPLPLDAPPGKEIQVLMDLQAAKAGGVYTEHHGLASADGNAVPVDGSDVWGTVVVGKASWWSRRLSRGRGLTSDPDAGEQGGGLNDGTVLPEPAG